MSTETRDEEGNADRQSRRDFVRRIAKGAIYAAPVVSTFAAPTRATAQASDMGQGMGLGGGTGGGMDNNPMAPAFPSPSLQQPPWSRTPPGG